MRKNQELISEFTRTAFTTDRVMEFFTESELTTQIGYGKALWPLVLSKELIDNALDACEGTRTAPVITITLEPDGITVADNGPGLNPEIIKRSLDYRIRISDKKYYVAPTRGQLGNALKCVWAASFVANGPSHRNPPKPDCTGPGHIPYNHALGKKRHFRHGALARDSQLRTSRPNRRILPN